MPVVQHVEIESLCRDAGTQLRAQMLPTLIAEYAEIYREGGPGAMGPLSVVSDGEVLILVDGFHRVEAARAAGLEQVVCEIRTGLKRDAVLAAAAANATHGARRTRADVRTAIRALLEDEEWRQWSDRRIAEQVRCSHHTVATTRKELSGQFTQIAEVEGRLVERGGTVYRMQPRSAAESLVDQAIQEAEGCLGAIEPSPLTPEDEALAAEVAATTYLRTPPPSDIELAEWMGLGTNTPPVVKDRFTTPAGAILDVSPLTPDKEAQVAEVAATLGRYLPHHEQAAPDYDGGPGDPRLGQQEEPIPITQVAQAVFGPAPPPTLSAGATRVEPDKDEDTPCPCCRQSLITRGRAREWADLKRDAARYRTGKVGTPPKTGTWTDVKAGATAAVQGTRNACVRCRRTAERLQVVCGAQLCEECEGYPPPAGLRLWEIADYYRQEEARGRGKATLRGEPTKPQRRSGEPIIGGRVAE